MLKTSFLSQKNPPTIEVYEIIWCSHLLTVTLNEPSGKSTLNNFQTIFGFDYYHQNSFFRSGFTKGSKLVYLNGLFRAVRGHPLSFRFLSVIDRLLTFHHHFMLMYTSCLGKVLRASDFRRPFFKPWFRVFRVFYLIDSFIDQPQVYLICYTLTDHLETTIWSSVCFRLKRW